MYSQNKYNAVKAGETVFSLSFPYTDKSEVHVKITRGTTLINDVAFTFNSQNQIKLTTATQSGDVVYVYRVTDLSQRAVDFQNGAVLTENDLDDSNIQIFYAMQEFEDESKSGLIKVSDTIIDARDSALINIADPLEPKSATNKEYVDAVNAKLSTSVDTRIAAHTAIINNEIASAKDYLNNANAQTANKIATNNAATAASIKADNQQTSNHTTQDRNVIAAAKAVVLTSEKHVTEVDAVSTQQATVSTQQAVVSTQQADRAKAEADRAASNATLAGLPLGSYVWYPADDPKNAKDKNGLFIPNGRILKRNQCKDLWNAIQSGELPSVSESEWQSGQKGVYSTGDGTTTFRLPSIGGYFVRIAGDADPDHATRKVGAVQEDQNKAHTHKLSVVADAVKTVMTGDFDYGNKSSNWTGNHAHSGTTSTNGNHTHSFTRPKGDQNWSNGGAENSWWGRWSNVTVSTNAEGNHTHSFSTNTTGNHQHVTAIGSHNHSTVIPTHTHTASAASEGGNETRPTNTWMQPYIVWYQANNAKIGGFSLHGSWDVERNIVIGDPMNNKLTFGVAPRLPAGMDADGIGYLCVTEGKSNLIGAETTMLRGDRVVWYGSTWVHIQHSQVTSVNGKTGDAEITAEMLDTYTKEQSNATFLTEKQTDARYLKMSNTTNGVNDPRNKVVVVGQDGVTEVGQYIDMHHNDSNKDYDARITVNTDDSISTSGGLTVASTLNAKIVQQGGVEVFSPNNRPQTLSLRSETDGSNHAWCPKTTPKGTTAVLFNNSMYGTGIGLSLYSLGSISSWGDTSVSAVTYTGITAHHGLNKPISTVIATGVFQGSSYENQATGVYVQTMQGGRTAIGIVDFNNLVSTGVFLQDSNSNQAHCQNVPTADAGMLEVHAFNTSWIFQRYTDYIHGTIFSRCRYGDDWSPWHNNG